MPETDDDDHYDDDDDNTNIRLLKIDKPQLKRWNGTVRNSSVLKVIFRVEGKNSPRHEVKRWLAWQEMVTARSRNA